jgi:hypothetical protein
MTDFLYDKSNLLSSAGSVIDIFGVLPTYNISDTPQDADRRAFQADISTLRNDMNSAVSLVCENA